MKKFILSIFLIIFLSPLSQLFSQNNINYLEMRDSLNLITCSSGNDTLKLTVKRLQSIEKKIIINGKAEFFYDYGLALQGLGLVLSNDSLLFKSNEMLINCTNEESQLKGSAYGFLTWNYLMLDDCDKSKEYFYLYKINEKKKYWNHYLIDFYKEKCK